MSESYPLPSRLNTPVQRVRLGAAVLAMALLGGCSSNPVDSPPPTIDPGRAAVSPAVTATPPGVVRPLAGPATAAAFDEATGALLVLGDGDRPVVTVFTPSGDATPVELDDAATAMAGDGDGKVVLSTKGGYFRLDVASGDLTRVGVQGHEEVDFTAIARRADGLLVLGSADGTVFTLASDTEVGAQLKMFARVDGIVTQGNTAIVLDRAQTSVTSLNADGTASAQALRAGRGATTMVADAAGRVLIADTRGGELLVYGADPLILRQRYPVPDSPYGLASSDDPAGLVWVAQTATNTVVGYDLATGIPVEKVRHRTVQQPNSLAFDAASDTLYVVSATGAGVQVIDSAGVAT